MATSLPSPPSSRSPSPATNLKSKPELQEHENSRTLSVSFGVVSGEDNEREELSDQLDTLLESYLGLLDTYTKLREQLSKDFASGFFALAQANRNSTLGPGRRYGEEGYDKRMKALKRVQIEESVGPDQARTEIINTESSEGRRASRQSPFAGDNPVTTGDFAEQQARQGTEATTQSTSQEHAGEHAVAEHLHPRSEPTTTTQDYGDDPTTKQRNNPNHRFPSPSTSLRNFRNTPQPDPSRSLTETATLSHYTYAITPTIPTTTSPERQDATAPQDAASPTPPEANTTPASESKANSDLKPKDPLKWYGILVPPALRNCQTHFQSAVTGTLPDLLSTISALDGLEREIWRLRRDLGLLDLYNYYDPEQYKRSTTMDEKTTADGNKLPAGGDFGNTPATSQPAMSESSGKNRLQSGSHKATSVSSPNPSPDPIPILHSPTKKQSLLSSSAAATATEPRSRGC